MLMLTCQIFVGVFCLFIKGEEFIVIDHLEKIYLIFKFSKFIFYVILVNLIIVDVYLFSSGWDTHSIISLKSGVKY